MVYQATSRKEEEQSHNDRQYTGHNPKESKTNLLHIPKQGNHNDRQNLQNTTVRHRTKMYRLYRKMTINGHFSIESMQFWDSHKTTKRTKNTRATALERLVVKTTVGWGLNGFY